MALAKLLRDSFTIRVGGAQVGVATREAVQEVLVGHLRLPAGVGRVVLCDSSTIYRERSLVKQARAPCVFVRQKRRGRAIQNGVPPPWLRAMKRSRRSTSNSKPY